MTEIPSESLLKDIGSLIESARSHAAQYVNSSLVLLYWNIGMKIHHNILEKERAEYGEQIIKNLAKK